MTKQQIQKEWKRIRFELVKNKPKIKESYPPEIVVMRELLLLARFALCKIKIGGRISFYESLYQKIMGFYKHGRY